MDNTLILLTHICLEKEMMINQCRNELMVLINILTRQRKCLQVKDMQNGLNLISQNSFSKVINTVRDGIGGNTLDKLLNVETQDFGPTTGYLDFDNSNNDNIQPRIS